MSSKESVGSAERLPSFPRQFLAFVITRWMFDVIDNEPNTDNQENEC